MDLTRLRLFGHFLPLLLVILIHVNRTTGQLFYKDQGGQITQPPVVSTFAAHPKPCSTKYTGFCGLQSN